MREYFSYSTEQTENIGANFGKKLKSGDFVALFGEIGAGKTAFVRGLAKGLGITEMILSPTFTIAHEYQKPVRFVHFDMYRIESWDDLYSCAYFDYLNEDCIVACEWSENIENALPERYFKVLILKEEVEEDRRILISEVGFCENTCS
ncbi:MAG: tRNA (adenosine(37)-N6)-threonylcarbamoyltransferase complex ATPase subunit type 1 TsaE [Acutalibacteraceae bacterium]|jgi:tRNA threonylcarbamoyladenosine biosynthesis protein TsaE